MWIKTPKQNSIFSIKICVRTEGAWNKERFQFQSAMNLMLKVLDYNEKIGAFIWHQQKHYFRLSPGESKLLARSTFETLLVIWDHFQHLTPFWWTFETLLVIWDPFQHLTSFSFNIWDLIRYLRPLPAFETLFIQHLRPYWLFETLFSIWHPFGGLGRP